MSGIDDKMTMIDDWAPNPSPRTLMSSLLNEEFGSKSFSDMLTENKNDTLKEEESEDAFHFPSNLTLDASSFDAQKSSQKGGLAQRMARSGFNAPTINTAGIRSANMAPSSSEIRSPYLTIPPGLSPTTLLDSPVFLSNSMVQPSPTTGKMLMALANANNSESTVPDNGRNDNEDFIPGGFAFKPSLNATSSYFSNLEMNGNQVNGQLQSAPNGFSESVEKKENADNTTFNSKPSDSFSTEVQPDAEGDQKGEISSGSITTPSEDGYNWRKYGQKQVKGSEYPRSYYKCTQTNCPVKKKVERNLEGHVTEIIYKGAHNHPKPAVSRRPEGQMMWTSDGMEATSSAPVVAEVADENGGTRYGSPEAVAVSSTLSNEEEDRATHGSVSIGGEGEGDETESKRRKVDAYNVEVGAASRAVREPRVVVQTTSEVDILDDGYRWRKYGQKVVKGNPNPRSYYKCTSPGCNVRKHVERASHDLKAVITTYEGKHNHDVPAARNSGGHSNAGPSSNPAPPVPQPQAMHRMPEMSHNGLMRFNSRPPLGAFGLPGHPGFAFGMGGGGGPQGFGNFGMPAGGMLHQYMGANGEGGGGFMVPKGELKEEPVSDTGMVSYHQLMNRLPLGPQL